MAADSRSLLSLDELTRLGGCGCCAAAQAIPRVITVIALCIQLCIHPDAQVLTTVRYATRASATDINIWYGF